jgi:hypothetical protein
MCRITDEKRRASMERRKVNPWTWQDNFGFSQAWRIEDGRSLIFVSGQGPMMIEVEAIAAV